MPKRFSVLCLLAGWFCASGAVLDSVQVYAWTRMFVGYLHQMPVAEAATETMDGSKPCSLCLALRHVREQSHPQHPIAGPAIDAAKVTLVAEEPAPMVFARAREAWPCVIVGRPQSWIDPVRVPPPRLTARGQAV